MRILMIDDEPELKAYNKHLDITGMTNIGKTVEEGIKLLSENEKFEVLYLDHRLPDGLGLEILTWLSDHLDKVPNEIFSISFMTPQLFYPMVQALQASAKRVHTEKG
jgi:DNA-binding response OmpR family regulator